MSRAIVKAIFKREFASYFATPVAYVFLVIFLLLMGAATFWIGRWFDAGQANLNGFFGYHPWLYLVLLPAIGMRMWAEERNSGTIELLLTQPLALRDAVLGKFLAAWAFAGIALLLSFPMWLIVNYLGAPDNGVIFASYIGSWLMAGAFLAIASCMSAATRNQVIAFVMTVIVGLCFLLLGLVGLVSEKQWLVQSLASLGFVTHFNSIAKGVLDLRDVLFFLSVIGAFLYATIVVIEMKKAD
jgi:ABC-2 type transport system permease protein